LLSSALTLHSRSRSTLAVAVRTLALPLSPSLVLALTDCAQVKINKELTDEDAAPPLGIFDRPSLFSSVAEALIAEGMPPEQEEK
jgi:hypothetical protein